MIRYTLSGTGGTADFPNDICFTQEKSTFVRFTATAIDPDYGTEVKLRISYEATSIVLSRNVSGAGKSVVFPLTAILESLAADYSATFINNVVLIVEFGDGSATHTLNTILIGTCEKEIIPISAQNAAAGDVTNYPSARKIVVYPGFNITQSIFIPKLTTEQIEVETENGVIVTSGMSSKPFAEFNPSTVRWDGDTYVEISVYNPNLANTFQFPIEIDRCTDGMLVKWTDKGGIPYIYRWSIETARDEISIQDAYSLLDDNLQPCEAQSKILTKTYTLHSRLVDQDIYDLCKSILAGRDISYYDSATEQWRRCSIEEGEAEDNGAYFKDLVVEITDKTYNV